MMICMCTKIFSDLLSLIFEKYAFRLINVKINYVIDLMRNMNKK